MNIQPACIALSMLTNDSLKQLHRDGLVFAAPLGDGEPVWPISREMLKKIVAGKNQIGIKRILRAGLALSISPEKILLIALKDSFLGVRKTKYLDANRLRTLTGQVKLNQEDSKWVLEVYNHWCQQMDSTQFAEEMAAAGWPVGIQATQQIIDRALATTFDVTPLILADLSSTQVDLWCERIGSLQSLLLGIAEEAPDFKVIEQICDETKELRLRLADLRISEGKISSLQAEYQATKRNYFLKFGERLIERSNAELQVIRLEKMLKLKALNPEKDLDELRELANRSEEVCFAYAQHMGEVTSDKEYRVNAIATAASGSANNDFYSEFEQKIKTALTERRRGLRKSHVDYLKGYTDRQHQLMKEHYQRLCEINTKDLVHSPELITTIHQIVKAIEAIENCKGSDFTELAIPSGTDLISTLQDLSTNNKALGVEIEAAQQEFSRLNSDENFNLWLRVLSTDETQCLHKEDLLHVTRQFQDRMHLLHSRLE